MSGNSKYKIISLAMAKLDANPVQGEGERSREATIAYRTYEPYRNDLLARKEWYWSTTLAPLSREAGTPEDQNWQYQYVPPADMQRMIAVLDENDRETQHYQHYNSRFYRNHSGLSLKYSRVVQEADFPDWFATALADYLAYQWCSPLNGSDTKLQSCYKDMRERYSRATQMDNQSRPPRMLYGHSSWVDGRNGFWR